jgi:sodium-dependent phosphate cotransporter
LGAQKKEKDILQKNNWDAEEQSLNVNPEASEKSVNPFSASIPELQQPSSIVMLQKEDKRGWWKSVNLSKVSLFIASLYLFILAITLMKDGAGGLGLLIQEIFSISNPANSLGFGWLSAYLLMSGSPVAASALTFFNTGVLDEMSTFAMITGSRLGASFIVLFIGFIYVMRGRDRATSLSMGLLSLTVTMTTYLPSFFLGASILRSGVFRGWQINSGALLQAFFEGAIYPISGLAANYLPEWAIFIIGLGIIMLSFSLFDRCLPEMTLKDSQVGKMSRLVYHPLVMFALGAAITLISMSVTLSLSILVPMSQRGFVRRENVIPYIMGANITTFVDTLFAAALLANSSAFTIVLVGMSSTTVVSISIMLMTYRSYQRVLLKLIDRVTSNNRNMFIFMISIFVLPLLLMVFT